MRRRLNKSLLDRSKADPAFARRTWRVSALTFSALARHLVWRGTEILARGRVLRTDRLHGHLMGLLQGIPQVVEDNSYGKISAYHDTWTHACTLTHWADTPEDAVAIATDLIHQSR